MSNRRQDRTPTTIELLFPPPGSKLVTREPRQRTVTERGQKRTVWDNPAEQEGRGKAMVALGTAALAFASLSLRRTRRETQLIREMWNARTTVGGLREMAAAGRPLPQTVLLRGVLRAGGPPVQSIASQVGQLRPLLGTVNQPENFFLGLAARGIKLPAQFDSYSKEAEDVQLDPRTMQRQVDVATDLALTELFVTRLSCEATKRETRDSNKNTKIEINRKSRAARFNVLHQRRQAGPLRLEDPQSDAVPLLLPPPLGPQQLVANDSPSLFLSLPDAMNEFKTWLKTAATKFGLPASTTVINADKPLTHLSKFIHLDQTSVTDLGAFQSAGAPPSLPAGSGAGHSAESLPVLPSTSPASAPSPVGKTALDEIGEMFPDQWVWAGPGFYDNNVPHHASFPGKDIVGYAEFRRRMAIAAEENAVMQVATEYRPGTMRELRDQENAFRVVELAVPKDAEVTVLASPRIADKELLTQRSSSEAPVDAEPGQLVLVPPPEVSDITEARFFFRILKGGREGFENLLLHRKSSMGVYLGFAVMGVATVGFGEEMIRDSLVVHYLR